MSKVLAWGARFDRTGLAAQMDSIIRAIRPDIIVGLDSSGFNRGAPQDFHKYDGFEKYVLNGFPTNRDIVLTLKKNITHAFLCETAYNDSFYSYARHRGVKTFTWINPEYFEPFLVAAKTNIESARAYPLPSTILLPSTWYESEIRQLLPNHDIRVLRPPIIVSDFKEARDVNLRRVGRRRFLHNVGRLCSSDRNGTLSLLEALRHTTADFELCIHSQAPLPPEYIVDDRRVRYDFTNVENSYDLYKDYDALILPRRYAGLCLPKNEALAAAMPVIMPRVSPNTDILPDDWLISAAPHDQLQTRILLDVYNVDAIELAAKIDSIVSMPDKELLKMKVEAYELASNHFSESVFREQYNKLIE